MAGFAEKQIHATAMTGGLFSIVSLPLAGRWCDMWANDSMTWAPYTISHPKKIVFQSPCFRFLVSIFFFGGYNSSKLKAGSRQFSRLGAGGSRRATCNTMQEL